MSSDLTTRAESLDSTPFRGRTLSAGGHGAPDLLGSRLNGSVVGSPFPRVSVWLRNIGEHVRPLVTSWQADHGRV